MQRTVNVRAMEPPCGYYAKLPFSQMPLRQIPFNQIHYDKCHYAKCNYAKLNYAICDLPYSKLRQMRKQ